MDSMIVVFPKRDNAVKIRNILVRAGMEVSAVCTTGAGVLRYVESWEGGIVVCGFRMSDMQYTELREWLPEQYDMLLAATPDRWSEGLPDGVVGLPVPFKAQDLIDTLEMMLRTRCGRKKEKAKGGASRRSSSERRTVERAKALLMERNNMSEEEAHRYLQKNSMQSGNSMTETARMVMMLLGEDDRIL